MGTRGPRPKPTIVQLAKGDPGKRARRRIGIEPMPESDIGAPPAWLDAAGLELWERCVRECEAAGREVGRPWLTALDYEALAVYCEAWSILVNNVVKAREHPAIVVRDLSGEIVATPQTVWRLYRCQVKNGGG
jgi:phage terminase small subunit